MTRRTKTLWNIGTLAMLAGLIAAMLFWTSGTRPHGTTGDDGLTSDGSQEQPKDPPQETGAFLPLPFETRARVEQVASAPPILLDPLVDPGFWRWVKRKYEQPGPTQPTLTPPPRPRPEKRPNLHPWLPRWIPTPPLRPQIASLWWNVPGSRCFHA